MTEFKESKHPYDLESLKLPRLAGPSLAIITHLVENPLSRGLLARQLFSTGGITNFRRLHLEDAPTFQPLPPPSPTPAVEISPQSEELLKLAQEKPEQPGFSLNTISDYIKAYQSGLITPEQVAEEILSAVESSNSRNPALRAIIALQPDDLRAQARQSTQRWKSGQPMGVLDGVPVAVKDEVDMLPYGTFVGTSFLGLNPPKTDSLVVARLRSSGAMLIGKANMHEIGIGVTGFNQHHGTARNPYHSGHHTGGSSSGPASAVSAGLAPLAVGADGGGSIRNPASFCGIVGLKPTYGRVSEFGAAPLTWSMGHLGPLGATAQDAAIGYMIMAGIDARDKNTLYQPTPGLKNFNQLDIRDITLGIYWPWFRHATPDIVHACEELLQYFETQGAKIREIIIPELESVRVAHMITITSEMAKALEHEYKRNRKKFSLEVRYDLAMAHSFTARDYLQAQRMRTRSINYFENAFKEVDVILSPTTAITAPMIQHDAIKRGESDLSLLTEIMRFVIPSNFTGHPAISFPSGYSAAGLPIGMQAIGRYWREDVLLRLAHVAQMHVERKTPQIYYDLLTDIRK